MGYINIPKKLQFASYGQFDLLCLRKYALTSTCLRMLSGTLALAPFSTIFPEQSYRFSFEPFFLYAEEKCLFFI